MLLDQGLRGVIAAIVTPMDAGGAPDHARFIRRARRLFDDGCDGLNVLGTTGEATSLDLEQRCALMSTVAGAGLPLDRMMVGTGAAALSDAISLTQHAAALGFAGALLLPPFYYKGVAEKGVLTWVSRVVQDTSERPIPIYLYNFPALSGVPYTPELVSDLTHRFGDRIGGLKDSSGDMRYAAQIAGISETLRVFPSNEASLLIARDGPFAGCISATANLNSADCARAYRAGDGEALRRAVAIRSLFDGLPMAPAIKALLARVSGDDALANLAPPLSSLGDEQIDVLWTGYRRLIERPVAAIGRQGGQGNA